MKNISNNRYSRAPRFHQAITLSTLLTLGMSSTVLAEKGGYGQLKSEALEVGLFTGVINIDNFGSEWVAGISGTFHASEDFFLQYNYLQTDVGLSSFERSQGAYFSGSDRRFVHYDLLVGYNVFQAEVYPRPGVANISSLYLVGGVGETRFGDEEAFTLTYGIGYNVALWREVILRVDYRNHVYDSSLVRGNEKSTQNTQFSVGINYLF